MKSPSEMKVIQIDITNACPKRCANCTRFCGHHTKPFLMDFDTFRKAVDSMKGYAGIVGIMGGEPTIHPEFAKFANYFRENFGYDDTASSCVQPVPDFMQHVLTNNFDIDYSNHRGLWTNINPKYYEHFELIQDTFGYQVVNDHSNVSMHETLMATRKELGIPDDEWFKLRDNCWIQNLWSASITPKGAFFCEVAAAMDMTLGGPGGWPIEPGWWKRKPCDFGDQLRWCELCSAALPMPSRNANEEIDDVSPVWREKLVQISSPKVKKGLVQEFDPKAYDPKAHEVIEKTTPYLDDNKTRIGSARNILRPQKVATVVWITSSIAQEEASALVHELKDAGRLDVVLYETPAIKELSSSLGLATMSAQEWISGQTRENLRERLDLKDWILLTRDCGAPEYFWNALQKCIFNPGTLHMLASHNSETGYFFNIRAKSFAATAEPARLEVQFPPSKKTRVNESSLEGSKQTMPTRVSRRLWKRVRWLWHSFAL